VEQRIRNDSTVTLVVNNAGLGPKGPMLDANLDELDTMIDVNVTDDNRLAIAAAQVFAERGSGSIINVASVDAFIPERSQGTYSATKAFVLNLTLGLHSEVGGKGVRVQAVLPGLTRTEIFERAGRSMDALDPK
ncbi:SDR family NAD(P)-dependent oxidoreductase, partial [Staphylococcus warneri]|uniref:SDR family NAD(P)-dependent oxidoreductase n=1 Tax=Staphylococcus warneri TaxID=1292 RepID=UPI00301B783C